MKKQVLTAVLALSLVMQGSSLVWAAEDVMAVEADEAEVSAAEVMQPELEAFGSGEEAAAFGDGTYGIVQESETPAEDSIFTENACTDEYSEEDFVAEEAEDTELLEVAVSIKLDTTHFPDAVFRKYLEKFDTDKNKTLSAAECGKIKKIDVKDVRNLAGIQYFPNLTDLKFSTVSGPMKKFDLTKNVKLEKLDIFCFGLTSLDVTKNVKLKELRCPLFGLKKLDVTHNPELTVLDLELNELTSLDVSKNTKLKNLNCSSNYIKKLNVTKIRILYL